MDEKISVNEKILGQAILIRENFNEMLMNGHAVQAGRDKFKIKNVLGAWTLVRVTRAGNEMLTDMSVNTLLYHLSNTDKT